MSFIKYVKLFGAKPSTVSFHEKLLSSLAGLAGICLIMLVSMQFLDQQGLPWVVASMGASAVLLFAVPNGPLSQPWSFVMGHLLSAFIGISVAKLIQDPVIASSLAVSLAILAMYLSNSLHPPGGATALTAVVGGSAITELGYWYLLTPISINLIIMLIWALIVNNLLPNRCYPNGIQSVNKTDNLSFSEKSDQSAQLDLIHRSDLHMALTEIDAFVDVSEDELTKIFNLSKMHTLKKKIGDILCRNIMTTAVTTVDYDTDVEYIWTLMMEKRVHAFPVVDKVGHVLGIVSLSDFLKQVEVNDNSNIISQLTDFIKKTKGHHTNKSEYAGHLMSKPVITINEKQHILDLFELFYLHNIHHIPVVDDDGKLTGIITPKDLLLTFQNVVQ